MGPRGGIAATIATPTTACIAMAAPRLSGRAGITVPAVTEAESNAVAEPYNRDRATTSPVEWPAENPKRRPSAAACASGTV